MRQPKQLISIDGTPLIVRTVKAVLASSAWPVVVVLGSSADLIKPLLARWPLQLVENTRWAAGIGTSLHAGIQIVDQFSSRIDAALITLGDQPHLTASTIQKLADVFPRSGGIAAARYSGVVGAPAIFGRGFFSELLALPADLGAQRVIRAHPQATVAVDMPEFAVDLDTPEDYQAFINAQKARARSDERA